MNLGADDYITKPFSEDELISAIESRLAKAVLLATMEDKNPATDGSDDNGGIRSLNELKNFFDDNGKIINCKKGDYIYRDGDHSNNIFLILKGVVKSHKMDESGKEIRLRAEGFLARVFQHEIDHTKGKLFVDHIKDKPEAFFKLGKTGKIEDLSDDERKNIFKNIF